MINVVVLMGRLVADPELKQTQNGTSVCSFRIAVDRNVANKQTGERQADFINITAWRQTAEFVCKYFRKGSMIAIEGSLQTRGYTDKDGNNRTAYDVVVEEYAGVAPVVAPAPVAPVAAPAPAAAPATAGKAGAVAVKAPMPGSLIKVNVKVGDSVKKGDVLCVLEAMKMENDIMAPQDGVVASVEANQGASVATDAVLVTLN